MMMLMARAVACSLWPRPATRAPIHLQAVSSNLFRFEYIRTDSKSENQDFLAFNDVAKAGSGCNSHADPVRRPMAPTAPTASLRPIRGAKSARFLLL